MTHKHLIQNYSNRPPVNCLIVARLTKNFRCDVVWCTYCAVSQFSASAIPQFLFQYRFQLVEIVTQLTCIDFHERSRPNLSMFAQTKVSQLDVAIFVKQNIIWLQIAVNVVVFMN